MKKSLFILIMALMATFSPKAALTADWRIHMTFDDWPIAVYDSPNRVYFLSRTFELNRNVSGRNDNSYVLHYYDKKGDEILTINSAAGASGNAVECASYNPHKGYMLVVYVDQNIDFIYDDGRIINLPALRSTSIPGKKSVNSISFDKTNNTAYLATTFGYVALNDQKHEVAESRNYGESLNSVARVGDNILLTLADEKIYSAPARQMRYNLSDYKVIPESENRKATEIMPLDGGAFLSILLGYGGYILRYIPTEDGYEVNVARSEAYMYNYQYTTNGYSATSRNNAIPVNNSGVATGYTLPEIEYNNPAIFTDNKNLWVLAGRKGLRHYTRDNNSWTLTADYMRPNSPATYISSALTYHPTYGLLAGSNGIDMALFDFSQQTPANLSALRGGFWKEYSPLYTNPTLLPGLKNLGGVRVDPNDNKYVYRTGTFTGIVRQNLEDPNDVMIFGNPSNSFKSFKGFVEVVPDQEVWNILCRFTEPGFDSEGRMWAGYNNADTYELYLYYWTAADRKATTSKQTYRQMKHFKVPAFTSMNSDVMTVLRHPQNKNIIAIGSENDYGRVFLYDHNGTPDNTRDDRYADVHFPYDQDGGAVQFLGINATVEDPETGLLWVLSRRGLFTLNPATAFDNPNSINRIKVARNDGTNLADYLLNEVNVYCMAIDGEGRKWFGTSNGLVCTSRDGKTILGEFTPENSPLPDDDVYAVAYNPENNSIMLATGAGLVEMFPSGSGGGTAGISDGVRVYPNPVEPDYYGWVRIDNIADGSLVKITDSTGGIVKELGPVSGGSVEWDVSGLNNRRVTTGVYYIMVSPGSGGGTSSINKILVLN